MNAQRNTCTLQQMTSRSAQVDGANWFESPAANPPTDTTEQAHATEESAVTYLEAIRFALEDSLAEDERVVILGEDIGTLGGAFRVTSGLLERFGPDRVIDTPMAETAIVGAGIGLAVAGMRPVVELQFADFISCAYDQLVSEAAKLHYRFGIAVPLVVRAPSGGGLGAGPFHSQCPEGIFAHIPGLKVVCPGSVQDAYDLLRASLNDPNPVLFFEQKALYRTIKDQLKRAPPDSAHIGRALVRRHGDDVTLVTYGAMLPKSLEAVRVLSDEGIDVEVIDLRTVAPVDIATVIESVGKTSRLVIAHEDNLTGGVGAEIAARVASDALFDLDAPIVRIAAPDTPVPFAEPLEDAYIPSVDAIAGGLRRCCAA